MTRRRFAPLIAIAAVLASLVAGTPASTATTKNPDSRRAKANQYFRFSRKFDGVVSNEPAKCTVFCNSKLIAYLLGGAMAAMPTTVPRPPVRLTPPSRAAIVPKISGVRPTSGFAEARL